VYLLCILLFNIGSVYGRDCKTADQYSKDNQFLKFFDECWVDTSNLRILSSAAAQLQDWFNTETYPVYIMVVMILIPYLFFTDDTANDDAARGNCIRLRGYVLLMKIGFAISIVPWLWAAFRQDRPCVCMNASGEYVPLAEDKWGMPSNPALAATVMGMHVAEAISYPLGIFFILIMSATGLLVGDYSIGQVIVAILIGIAFHFYSTRSFIYLRIVDFLVSFVVGVVILLVAKHQYPDGLNFSFSVNFLIGLTWQLYALALTFITFDFGFVKEAMRRTTRNLHEVDFLYYRSLNAPSSADEDRAQLPHETLYLTVATSVLFVVLCALRISAPYMDDLLGIAV